MAPRNGKEFIEGLRGNPGRSGSPAAASATSPTDPVFRRPVQSIAELYDLQARPEHREVMTYAGEDTATCRHLVHDPAQPCRPGEAPRRR